MKPIKVGVEIEAMVNDSITLNRGEYHHGLPISGLPGWKVECDSSVNYKPGDNWTGTPTELVSKIATSKDDFFKLLENFQDFFSKKGKLELHEALIFNQSCGTHIHFSLKGMKFTHRTIWRVFRETRNLFIRLLKESDIKSKNNILAQYYRHYAKKCTRGNYRSGRQSEWNFESEWDNRGIEWRSINLHQVDNWKDFIKLFEIVWTCLNYLGETAEKYTEQRTITVKPQTMELKHLKNDKMKPLIKIPEILLNDDIEIKIGRIFSKEGKAPESKQMVELRLKHLSHIESIRHTIVRITSEDITLVRNYFTEKKAISNENDLLFPNDDGYYYIEEIDSWIAEEEANSLGYRRPTLSQTKKLIRTNKIKINTDSNGVKTVSHNMISDEITLEDVQRATREIQLDGVRRWASTTHGEEDYE